MARQLRALVNFPEDLGLVPRAHIKARNRLERQPGGI